MNAYPQAHGVIIDGPGEQHYELAFHHGGELLEIREHERHRFAALGKDIPPLGAGHRTLRGTASQPDTISGTVSRPRWDAGSVDAI